MAEATYSPVKYLAATSQGPLADTTAAGRGDFVWRRAERPQAAAAAPASASSPGPGGRSARLAAAAELARRCAELGVMPPKPPAPQPLPLPPATAAPPAREPDRLEALAQQVQQHSKLMATAVQGHSQQLAAQQQLLADMVQGLLFVGAKANAPVALSQPQQQQQQSAWLTAKHPPSPSKTSAPARDLQSPPVQHTAALVRGLAAKLRPPQHAADSDGDSMGEEQQGCQGEGASPPSGLLRVPTKVHGSWAEPEAVSPMPRRLSAAARPEQRGAASDAPVPRQRVGRPAWDDRLLVAQPARGRRAAGAFAPVPPPQRLPLGGLAPELLLRELQRLQRRRSTGSGGGGSRGGDATGRRAYRAAMAPGNHPLTAPAGSSSSNALRQPASAAAVGQRMERAKQAPATAITRLRAAAAQDESCCDVGQPLLQCQPPIKQAAGAGKGAAPAPAAAGKPAAPAAAAAAVLQAPAGEPWAAVQQQQPQELSADDVDALCDRVCRELLLRECAPC